MVLEHAPWHFPRRTQIIPFDVAITPSRKIPCSNLPATDCVALAAAMVVVISRVGLLKIAGNPPKAGVSNLRCDERKLHLGGIRKIYGR
jgi:hypothetical protein